MKTWSEQGGAAFPVQPCDELMAEPGMTMRDYFAAKAMAAMITEPIPADESLFPVVNHLCKEAIEQGELTDGQMVAAFYAKAAYCMADAMLAERDQ